jgi:hypothetical protein
MGAAFLRRRQHHHVIIFWTILGINIVNNIATFYPTTFKTQVIYAQRFFDE